jgi:predicted Zn-dependent protease
MFGVLDAPKLTKYVNLVGQSVAQYAPRQVPYRFGILDSEIVGAFALPGGFIFITKTALEGMTNESQLAGALGHEVIHVSERHLESAIRGKKNSAWAMEEAKSKTSSMTPDYIRGRADAFLTEMFNMRLSRDKEDGADERGTLLAAQAGYSASGLLDFLKTLSLAQAKPENQRAFGQLMSTHPPFDERISHLTPIVAKNSGGKTLEARFRATVK